MDIKAPLEKYHKITNSIVNTDNIKRSVRLIMASCIDYEFRTTVLSSQLSQNDFQKIAEEIAGCKKYYLQKFVSSKIYNTALKNEKTYSNDEFVLIKNILEKSIDFVEIR